MAVDHPRLSGSSYAVLGMVALRGPSSPYDIKRALGHLAGEFWSVQHTQLYDETSRLAHAGLLDVEQATTGRRRRTYTITAIGRAALREWLAASTPESLDIRDVAQLKLFFSELAAPGDIRRLADEQVAIYRARLDELNRVAAAFGDRPARNLSIPLGQAVYRAALDFWSEVAATESGRGPSAAPRRR
jgi:DNA-binding PadR family transcriptional regulator